MKEDRLTKREQSILDVLTSVANRTFYGAFSTNITNRSRISRQALCQQFQTSDRWNRRTIHRLRKKGYPICSDMMGGYWLGTDAEWKEFCSWRTSVAMASIFD